MSALGQKQTFRSAIAMSANPKRQGFGKFFSDPGMVRPFASVRVTPLGQQALGATSPAANDEPLG
jgi:hypothetical protein